jgi:methionyl-tRNA formyltransferase
MTHPLKIIFAGTPAFSLPCLQALHHAGHNIVAVLTQPDRPSGRGQKLQASPIKQWALEHDLTVLQPLTLRNTDIQEALKKFNADVMVVVAYGLILPKVILDMPTFGCINVHASLLPRWRGAAPIQYAIRSGDTKTGITIMQMDVGMDTGDILKQADCSIDIQDTSETLFNKLSLIGPKILLETLDDIQENKITPIPQDEAFVTYSPKIEKQEAHINWNSKSEQILLTIRAFYPWPICYTEYQGIPIKIHQGSKISYTGQETPGTILSTKEDKLLIKTSDGAISIQAWQWPNQKVVSIKDWLHAKANLLQIGSQFQ